MSPKHATWQYLVVLDGPTWHPNDLVEVIGGVFHGAVWVTVTGPQHRFCGTAALEVIDSALAALRNPTDDLNARVDAFCARFLPATAVDLGRLRGHFGGEFMP